MFDIRPLPPQIPTALRDRLGKVETATIGHILHAGFVDPAIRAVLPGRHVVGTAVTVQIPGADSTLLHHMLGQLRPGDLLVVDRCGDRRHACLGGVVARVCREAGVVAAIIDGPATDLEEVREQELPVWCRGETSLTTKLLALRSSANVPVSVGGVAICPGDVIVADSCGVVAMAPALAEEICDKALAMQDLVGTMLERLHAGEKLGDISGANELIRGRTC